MLMLQMINILFTRWFRWSVEVESLWRAQLLGGAGRNVVKPRYRKEKETAALKLTILSECKCQLITVASSAPVEEKRKNVKVNVMKGGQECQECAIRDTRWRGVGLL